MIIIDNCMIFLLIFIFSWGAGAIDTRDMDALNGEPGALDLINCADAVAGVGGEDAIYMLTDKNYVNSIIKTNDNNWRQAA